MRSSRAAGTSWCHRVMCAAGGGTLLCVTGPVMGGVLDLTPGTYQLSNHPDANLEPPPYGLRLDELIDVTAGDDRFTFNFNPADNPGVGMFLDLIDNGGGTFTIHIYGTAFGGLDVGGNYNPMYTGLADIDFTYTNATEVPGDGDLWVVGPAAVNSGTINFMGNQIGLWDYPNEDGFTFRLGNEDDDMGHRDFPGISGWGWLNHGSPDTHFPQSDWLFTIVPAPGAVGLLGVALLVGTGRHRRR